jgi:hypothetical protein
VPVASLGVDDAFDIAFDSGDLPRTPLRHLYDRLGARRELVLPIPGRVRPERLYFYFGKPIDVASYALGGRAIDDACLELREDTRDAIRDGIEHLKEIRGRDDRRFLFDHARATLADAGLTVENARSTLVGLRSKLRRAANGLARGGRGRNNPDPGQRNEER